MKKHLKKVGLGMLASVVCVATVAVGVSQYGKIHETTTVEENVNATGNIEMHFKWSGDSTPHLYYTNVNNSGEIDMSYPGVPMKAEGNGWYSYTITDADSADLVISVPDKGYETNTFERTSGAYWYDDGRGWFTQNPDAAVMAENQTADTAKNNGVIAVDTDASQVAAEEGITVHFVSDWAKANIYYWNAMPNDMEISWPGENMAKDEDGYYTYTFQGVSKINLLFTNGSEQTADLTVKSGEWWYNGNKWSSKKPSSHEPVDPVPTERGDFRDESIYFMMTSRFYDGDSSNNCVSWRDTGTDDNNNNPQNAANDPVWRGDFKGIVEKLDYIKALGFSAIWITPVVKNASDYDYHGYHAINHSVVDVRYESDDCSYQDLINACHEKGIRVIQDIVLNHCSDYGEENLFPAYTRSDDVSKLGRSDTAMTVTDLGRSIGMSDATTTNEAKRCENLKSDENDPDRIFHHEKNCQWEGYTVQTGQMGAHCVDLNTENPIVTDYLTDCYTNYINMGVDAFRIDTVKHVSRLSFNKAFLPAFKEAGGENFFMFGEACVLRCEIWNANIPPISVAFYTWKETGNYDWKTEHTAQAALSNEALVAQHFEDHSDVGSQPTSNNAFLNGNEYHTPDRSKSSGMDMIDFYMHHSFINANDAFGVALSEDQYFNDSTYNVMYVDSHDYGPNGGSLDQRYNGSQANWAENLDLIFTFRGIPCIYYGSEIEFKKGEKIDDWYNPLEKSGRAYFGDNIEGSVNTTDFGVYSGATGAMADTLNHPLAKHIQRLNLIRRAVPALRKGQYSTEGCSGGICYKRRYTDGGTDSFVCVTISGDATFSGIPSGTYVDMVTGDTQQCSGTLTASCSGQGNMRVYVLQTNGAPDGKIGEGGTYLK